MKEEVVVVVVPKRFRIRTIAAFVNLETTDFSNSDFLTNKIQAANRLLRHMAQKLTDEGYAVQTVRIATNPFGEWLLPETKSEQLAQLDALLDALDVSFCALGPADTVDEILHSCPAIVAASPRFSCSANVAPAHSDTANAVARCILDISKLDQPPFLRGGLGNFRFCAAASCKPFIPFFPAAKSSRSLGDGLVGFAVGLENGGLAMDLLKQSRSIEHIRAIFGNGMTAALAPVQQLAEQVAVLENTSFLGIDTSLNPSLDQGGSVAEAIECLAQVTGTFGGPGTLAAAAAITTTLQSLPGITTIGYCGLMLPVCEDQRLAEIAATFNGLQISTLLSISSVCGVGVDTVPIPGDCTEADLSSLILDVAALAGRWDKSLSCRVFPVPGSKAGDMTAFDSPYLCNSRVFDIR
jgi:uncharacterized protein